MNGRLISRLAHATVLPVAAFGRSRPTVRPADYAKRESLGATTLSPNGKWLAYGVNRVNEENELRLGATARDTTVAIPNASGAVFAGDSRWLAYAIGVSPDERDRPHEGQEAHSQLGFRNLTSGATEVAKDVSQFRSSRAAPFRRPR